MTIKDPTGLALESAVVDDPDDLAAHLAFTDWLSEQADPVLQARGEFARVQIDLADEKRSRGRRKALKQREQELLAAHERVWLGERLLALLSDPGRTCDREYQRGWLHRMHFSEFTAAQARALAQAPALRLLRHLDLNAESADKSIASLARSPHLGNVRELVVYFWHGGAPLESLVARMGRLEGLNVVGEGLDITPVVALPLPHLTELWVGEVSSYPLREIAANASLGRLETLTLAPPVRRGDAPPGLGFDGVEALARSPHLASLRWLTIHRSDMGDEGVRELIDSGLIDRLESLDLAHGSITDVGARALAGCRGAKRLYSLNLVGNHLTETGLRALQCLKKVQVDAYGQRAPGEDWYLEEDSDDLHDDDWE